MRIISTKATFEAVATDPSHPLHGLVSYASAVGLKFEVRGDQAVLAGQVIPPF